MIFAQPNNLTYIPEILTYANQVTNGSIGFVFLLVIGFGTFMLTSAFSLKGALAASVFITSIVSFFLFILGLISLGWLFITVLVFIIMIIFIATMKGGNA